MPAEAVDCHAHVFARGLPLAGDRRYAPDYDATPAQYLSMLDANGCSHGVLVQPSFLGTDNSYLLMALRQAPNRLKGIAVLDAGCPSGLLKDLDAEGVVGIRLNLIGKDLPDLRFPPWRHHLALVADLGWQIEVQVEASRLPGFLSQLLEVGTDVVLDHFGKPSPELGVADPGFREILSAGGSGRLWVKVSAAYRNGPKGADIAEAAIPLLRDALGAHRLLWGSDWPHTQFESRITPQAARQALDLWFPEPEERATVLWQGPARLFRFSD
jgi:predicted TIM-barrel fold metal-dependent hydrolase